MTTDAFARLDPDVVVEGRPFTDPERAREDVAVLREMLGRMRTAARGWLSSPPAGPDALVRESDATGLRTWIRVPDLAALLAARKLTTVAFFGRARADVDHAPINLLEESVVATLEHVPGILSYFDLELSPGRYGNLILCEAPDVPVRWREHRAHRRAVELSPGYYHSVRLHSGIVRSSLLGDGELVLLRTRYFDFDVEPTWLAERTY